MAKREPTIEQNSHFTAKTKQGQDVEFETTLKFYITPSGEVTLSVPGGRQSTESSTTMTQDSMSQRTTTQESSSQQSDANAGRRQVEQSDSGTSIQAKRRMSDDNINRAFPPGPDPPTGCAMNQFIPDPCRAVDDAVKSIKGLYNNFFSGPKCPPPTNTDNLNIDYMPLHEKSERDYSEQQTEVMENDNNENKEMMENEQKYDM